MQPKNCEKGREQASGREQTSGTEHRQIPYDDILEKCLVLPLVWESDIRSWLCEWNARVIGLKARQRSPKHGANHTVELP
jgi:hypothetical protein